MANRNQNRSEQARHLVAQEAARIMAEEFCNDYGQAKRKAAQRLGIADQGALPRNHEIEQALEARQRLFAGDRHSANLQRLRSEARRAMELFGSFEPRLVGSLLNGTATNHSDISLHLFADTPEAVAVRLMDQGIPFETSERRYRYLPDRSETRPTFRFQAGDVTIDATVFPTLGLRQAPCSPVDGRPMRRASLNELEALLAAT